MIRSRNMRHTATAFRRYFGCDDLKVDGVVVGARRAITQQMAAKLSVLGLGPGEMDLMQKRARGPFSNGSWVGSRLPRGEVVKDRYTRPSRGAGVD